MKSLNRTPTAILFTTVMFDLIGFGMVIPLISVYGRHYGATGISLAILGGIYSLMQFFSAPFWGMLSDRFGRRPIILMALCGSTISYLIFGLAENYWWLLASRAFGGVFAANIVTAQAFIADSTKPEERAAGMGLIGAAFGIGFTIGPAFGGSASHYFGISAPGILAAIVCGCNFLLALRSLPESLPVEQRKKDFRYQHPFLRKDIRQILASRPQLRCLISAFFMVTLAFSNMEQTFSLLFQGKFHLTTEKAGFYAGMILLVAGLIGVLIQGKLICGLVRDYGEARLLLTGLAVQAFTMVIFPFPHLFLAYIPVAVVLAIGSSLVTPTLNGLISRAATAEEQGLVLGFNQGLGSLARALGPFLGLLAFEISSALPYFIAATVYLTLLVFLSSSFKESTPA
ncbi:MFS transporter [bacterium]|nr:MFS transporter [bacterium]